MAWVKTIKYDEADAHLQEILMKTRMNYPPEYAAPMSEDAASPLDESIVDSHTLIPDALFHTLSITERTRAERTHLQQRPDKGRSDGPRENQFNGYVR